MRMLFLAMLAAGPVAAQAHPDHGAPAAQAEVPAQAPAQAPAEAPVARLNLDTPVEAILADEAGKAVIAANIPELPTHDQYPAIKQMGLRQIAAYAPERLTPELLARVEAQLAAIR